jgi:hypothetical protein
VCIAVSDRRVITFLEENWLYISIKTSDLCTINKLSLSEFMAADRLRYPGYGLAVGDPVPSFFASQLKPYPTTPAKTDFD